MDYTEIQTRQEFYINFLPIFYLLFNSNITTVSLLLSILNENCLKVKKIRYFYKFIMMNIVFNIIQYTFVKQINYDIILSIFYITMISTYTEYTSAILLKDIINKYSI